MNGIEAEPPICLPSAPEVSQPDSVPVLVWACRRRRQLYAAEQRLTAQIGALHRFAKIHGGKDLELLALDVEGAIGPEASSIRKKRLALDKEIAAAAETLPINIWLSLPEQRGCGALGLGLIVGAAGDIGNYANPSRLWKRMGLAVMQDGQRQRRVKGTTKATKAEAIAHGYNPKRRSLMHVIGDCLVKGNRTGPYRTCYLERKAYETAQHPELPLIQRHRRAMRYMEKRFLRELWLAWRAHMRT